MVRLSRDRHRSYRSMTRGSERLCHALFRPRQNVAAGSHSPSNQNRLTCELQTTCCQSRVRSVLRGVACGSVYLVVYGDERVVWWKRPGGAFPVDQQRLLPPVHHVLLHLGDVVGYVIDHVHVQVVRRRTEHLSKGLTDKYVNKVTMT